MVEADARFLEALLSDVEPLLGPGVVVEALDRDDSAEGCVLRLRYRLGSVEATSEGEGETVVAAHAALREAVVLDRI
ncbi:MAG TPA: hypothetical protein VFS32_02805, partial [Candidatus Limnocylindrales bacterium]|nr:hypothetical protein [Candidatus Limnocylindrales bacterium]